MLAAGSGDADARAMLVDAFMPLIGSVASIYRGSRAVDRGELMQEGVVGLLSALERYDPDRGTPFWAYASLVGSPGDAAARRRADPAGRPLRPGAAPARARKGRAARASAGPRPRAVERRAGRDDRLTRDQVENLLAVERAPRALEEPIGDGDDNGRVFGELLADPVRRGRRTRRSTAGWRSRSCATCRATCASASARFCGRGSGSNGQRADVA